ncbi:putative lipoprotein [Leptospira wolffii]|uniref:Lipoprotein n=1 Tax=Leptospira wolffii TaxID=409998 RepID=A0ABV5BSB3_9LEPT
MKSFQKSLGLTVLAVALFSFQNCFILDFIASVSQSVSKSSDSAESLSKSITSVVSSVSSSSADEAADKKAYKREVETLTAFYLQNGPASSEFESDLAELASKNGIVNWRSSESTYVSIGRGLKKAGMPIQEFKNFSEPFAANRPFVAKALEKGYNSL